jgi:hypothetical protein
LRLRVRGSPADASTRPDLVRDVSSTQGPKSAASPGYYDTELEGQYRIPDGQQCMKFTDVRELLVVDVVVARDAVVEPGVESPRRAPRPTPTTRSRS